MSQLDNPIIARWEEDFRGGKLEGMFITTRGELSKIYGKSLYFGEVIGKHSEVELTFEESDFVIVTEDIDFIICAERVFGTNISGYSPFDYLPEEDEEPVEDEESEEE